MITSDAVVAAASNGHLDCLGYLIAQGTTLPYGATHSATLGGHIECLKLLRAHDCPRDANCVTVAASAGNLHCVEYLLQDAYYIDDAAVIAAITNGHVHCLAAILQSLNPVRMSGKWVDIAVTKNNMDSLKLLFSTGTPLDLRVLHSGFRNSDHKVYLSKLVEVGYQFPFDTAMEAIRCSNFECLKYLCEERKVNLTSDVCDAAARQVNLQYMKLLRQYNCPWSTNTCASAAASSNLACLKYLRAKGCPWDATTFTSIMDSNKVPRECLIYALEHGCPWGDSFVVRGIVRLMHSIALPLSIVITNAAAECGSVECLEYVLAQGAPAVDASTCAAAARYQPDQPLQCLVMLGYLLSVGCLWDERTTAAAAAHPTSTCLRYVHERGCPWTCSTTLAAASNDFSQCLQYAL